MLTARLPWDVHFSTLQNAQFAFASEAATPSPHLRDEARVTWVTLGAHGSLPGGRSGQPWAGLNSCRLEALGWPLLLPVCGPAVQPIASHGFNSQKACGARGGPASPAASLLPRTGSCISRLQPASGWTPVQQDQSQGCWDSRPAAGCCTDTFPSFAGPSVPDGLRSLLPTSDPLQPCPAHLGLHRLLSIVPNGADLLVLPAAPSGRCMPSAWQACPARGGPACWPLPRRCGARRWRRAAQVLVCPPWRLGSLPSVALALVLFCQLLLFSSWL